MSGEIAAQIAMKIINGTPPETFNTVIESPNIFCIDENVMRNAGLDLSLIPDNAKVINHKKTFWEEYKRVLKPGMAVMSGFILFSLFALWNSRKYKRLAGELAAAKDKLENAYYHDILTGINNRTKFKKNMEEQSSDDTLPGMRHCARLPQGFQGFQMPVLRHTVLQVMSLLL